jgi:hypothetical protein
MSLFKTFNKNFLLAVSFISNIFLFIQITYYQKQQIESLEKFKELETLKDQIDQMVKKLNEMELKSNSVTEEPLIKPQIFSFEGLDIFFNNINFLELYSPVTNNGIFNIIISCCVLFSLGYSLYNVKYIASALITMPQYLHKVFFTVDYSETFDNSGNLIRIYFETNEKVEKSSYTCSSKSRKTISQYCLSSAIAVIGM